jgi:hypothetical protein
VPDKRNDPVVDAYMTLHEREAAASHPQRARVQKSAATPTRGKDAEVIA